MRVDLAFAVILVCLALILCRDPAIAVALAGILLGADALARRPGQAGPEPPGAREGFVNAPPSPEAPYLASVGGPAGGAPQAYPGAIALDMLDELAGLGHPDRAAADSGRPEGNPADPGRSAAPWAAGPCVDDEANSAEIDVDEGSARSALSRNDPIRPAAGTLRRKKFLDPLLREEVEEFEELPWYGRHEL